MRDFLPAEKAHRERVLDVIRRSYRAHGFDEVETPVMEDAERLHSGLGGDNEKLAFAVLRRGLTADDLTGAKDAAELADLGLRFDLTVPLARFVASHRAELPSVFRAIQLGPVWRAERPQKGRYRQFVQCDIDILGEPGIQAEAELLVATLATVDALGLTGAFIRVNDRRLLLGMLEQFGFVPAESDSVLITIDKLDKLGADGVVAELRERGATPSAVDAFEQFLRRPTTMAVPAEGGSSQTTPLPFGAAAIRKALPEGADDAVVAELAAVGEAVYAARGADPADVVLQFDPFLVRGMGYYTGAIFELAHPSVDYSLGGGGRYDGMVGRFLGSEVPAVGMSLGFERIVDLADLPGAGADGVALIAEEDVPIAELVRLQSELVAQGRRTRIERRARNMAPLLQHLAGSGFTEFAYVGPGASLGALEFRDIARQ
jgi:histidyl-tRNA synthetase